MMAKNTGFCWHVHHNILMEWCYDYEGRVHMIRGYKPKGEIKSRLRLFQFVKSEIPDAIKAAQTAHDDRTMRVYRAISHHRAEIEALHSKECPHCLWDGNELDFSRRARALNFLKRILRSKV